MAQWARAYCGETHETKVADAEHSLRLAVAAYHDRETLLNESKQKQRQIHQLAERVLTSRLKALKARVSALESTAMNKRKETDSSHLRLQIQAMSDEGVSGILKEFNAP
jgi:hypothetical protein